MIHYWYNTDESSIVWLRLTCMEPDKIGSRLILLQSSLLLILWETALWSAYRRANFYGILVSVTMIFSGVRQHVDAMARITYVCSSFGSWSAPAFPMRIWCTSSLLHYDCTVSLRTHLLPACTLCLTVWHSNLTRERTEKLPWRRCRNEWWGSSIRSPQ